MSGRAQVIALALAGLVVAALLGLAASFLASDTIALPATSLAAGERLVPPTTTTRPATTATPTTESTPTTTSDDHGDDDGSGRGRGRNRGRGGGDDD